MFSNYFKIAIRNIIKHKGYSIINIAGLAIGLAIFSLIAENVEFHFSFDRFHKDADRIYSIHRTGASIRYLGRASLGSHTRTASQIPDK
jgi:putative ABC transport system permease protein